MTTFTINAVPLAAQEDVVVSTKVDGYSVKWKPQPTTQSVEVWEADVNDVNSAVLVGTARDTYYDSRTLAPGSTKYIWTRRKTAVSAGPFDAGSTITIGGINPSQVGFSETPVDFAVAVTVNPVTGINESDYDEFETYTTATFTVPTTGAGHLAIDCKVTGDVYPLSGGTVDGGGFGFGQAQVRFRLYNVDEDVYLIPYERMFWMAVLSTSVGGTTVVDFYDPIINNHAGFHLNTLGGLKPGVTYRYECDVGRGRSPEGYGSAYDIYIAVCSMYAYSSTVS